MRRSRASILAALAVVAAASAAAQTVWITPEFTMPLDDYLECAVLADRVESVPGDAPEWAGEEVEFLRIAEEMYAVGSMFHGASLSSQLVEEFHLEWGSAEVSVDNQVLLANTLQSCLSVFEIHMPPVDPARPRMSREELQSFNGR